MRNNQEMKSDSSWRNALVSAGLAFSLPGTVGGPAVVGYLIDRHYGSSPWWLLIGLLLGFIGAAVEISIIAKRMKQQ